MGSNFKQDYGGFTPFRTQKTGLGDVAPIDTTSFAEWLNAQPVEVQAETYAFQAANPSSFVGTAPRGGAVSLPKPPNWLVYAALGLGAFIFLSHRR